MNERTDYWDFWIGFAFGSTSVAAFLAAGWAHGYFGSLIP